MSLEAMTCNTAREMVQKGDYGGGVMAHLRECDRCIDVALNDVLPSREDISMPPAFGSQVLARLSALPTTAAPPLARKALWPAIMAVCVVLAALSLPHLSAFAQSLWGIAVLGAAGMEVSLIIVWVLRGNRSAWVMRR